jgi:hypothetical protein
MPSASGRNSQSTLHTMPKKEKNTKKRMEETHLKQNYVHEDDLIPFLEDRFGNEFRIRVCLYTNDDLICGCGEGFNSTDARNVDT